LFVKSVEQIPLTVGNQYFTSIQLFTIYSIFSCSDLSSNSNEKYTYNIVKVLPDKSLSKDYFELFIDEKLLYEEVFSRAGNFHWIR
jgi:hypothetical protein